MPHPRIKLVIGDITTQQVDAIVNAANSSLLGGGGVDGAIHAAAGPDLLGACRKIGGCPAGEARITPGFRLPARFVIHTVGPVWRGGSHDEDQVLARAYRNTLKLAHEHGITSIAFPSISTGAYRFPLDLAADVALHELLDGAERYRDLRDIRMVLFSEPTFRAYQDALDALD